MFKSILKFFVVFLIFIFGCSFQFNPVLAKGENSQSKQKTKTNQPESNFVSGEILVKFKDKINPNQDESLKKFNQGSNDQWQEIFKGKAGQNLNLYQEKVKAGKEKEFISQISKNPHVEWAELNSMVSAEMVPNDPYYSSSGSWGQAFDDLWGIKKIQSANAWDSSQGSGIKVAVVDSGVDYNHEDLAANIWQNPEEIGLDANGHDKRANGVDDDGNGYIDDWEGWDASTIITEYQGWSSKVVGSKLPDNDPMDDHGHGTHVAGTIAAVGNNGVGVIGVAPMAKIIPVKFLTQTGDGTCEDAASALVYAADLGANVINNSWGGSYCHTVEDAINYAHNKGAVIIASAGNSSAENWNHVPGSFPGVIAVSATDNNDNLASFSSFGKVDVAAPGVDILSTKSLLDNLGDGLVGQNYRVLSGTSMAAPHVCGAAVLVLSKNPSLNNEEVRQIISESADDLGTSGFDPQFGFGRLNADKAVTENRTGQALIIAPIGKISETIVAVKGIAQASNFNHYKLEFGAGSQPSSWNTITESITPSSDILGTWNLSGLSPGQYTLLLSVYDTSGNFFQNRSIINYDSSLTISNIQINSFSPQETIFHWNTNREVESYIEYGLDTNYGTKASETTSYTDHVIQLLNLEPETTYHFRITAEEFAHIVQTQDQTFATPQEIFSIQNIQVVPAAHQATITWTTAVPSDSEVQFNYTYWSKDLTYRWDYFVSDPTLTTNHSIALTDFGGDKLYDNMEYVFITKSKDGSGNGATSAENYFTTLPGQYPVISNLNYQNVTENSALVVWDTDLPSTSEIRYYTPDWVYPYYSWREKIDNTSVTHHEILLSDLIPAATFRIGISAISSDGSVSVAGDQNLKTPESSHISNLTVSNITSVSAQFNWQTDVPANATVRVSIPGDYHWFMNSDPTISTNHQVTVFGLSASTIYQYKVQSVAGDNYYISASRQFTTQELDTKAPTGSISINNGASATNLRAVTLNLLATDNVVVTDMQFSNDDQNYSAWEQFSLVRSWSLLTGDGQKSVYVHFRDAAGNVSPTYSDSIILDTLAPIIYAPQTTSPTENKRSNWNWQAATDNGSGVTGIYKFFLGTSPGGNNLVNGEIVNGTAYTYLQDLAFGTYYAYITTMDNAGNTAVSANGSVTIKDLTPPTGSILINNGAASTKKFNVILNLSASDNFGGQIQMRFSNDNKTWTSWENFASTKKWTLTKKGHGIKYVYVQYRDVSDNISTFFDTIIY